MVTDSNTALQVLVVEGQALDGDVVETILHRPQPQEIVRVATANEARARMLERKFDLVVTDETRLRAVLDGVFVFVGVFSLDGVIVDVNRAPLAASGLARTDVVGRRFVDMPWFSHAPAERARVADAMARAARGEPSRFETNVRRISGSIMYVDAAFAPLRDETGAVVQVLGSGIDVTARKTADVALADSEARLAEAQRVAHVGSWEWDVASNRVTWSDELYRVYGVSWGEFDGTYEGFLSRVHPDDVAVTRSVVRQAMEHATPFVYDHRVVRPDGEVRMLHTRGEAIADAEGRTQRMVGSCWDMTERWQSLRAAEKARAEAEASGQQLRALAARLDAIREDERRLIAREIHDRVGQELTALKLELVWLRAHIDNPEVAQRAARMEALLDGTLETTRRVSADLRPVLLEELGLTAAVGWQARDFETRTGLPCTVAAPWDGAPLAEPRTALALYRILQEALANVMRHAGATHVWITLAPDRRDLVLTIEDDGRGITTEEMGRPSALGLLGMRERALVVGGTVTVERREQAGTRVTARVPIKSAPP
jgi:PAS domain S-box-containing protein